MSSDALPENREKVGDVFGVYTLERELGEGTMGRVWLARHTKLGRSAAIKVLKPRHTQNNELVNRFFDEARAVNQINHEHIIAIADFVEERDPPRVYCVMEYLQGESLERRLTTARLPLADALVVMRQVCDALATAHAAGIVHRDVKPDNIFVMTKADGSPFAKVLDFGVAKLTPALKRDPVSSTQVGQLIGTPSYMAPEQLVGLEVDAKADVYAAGTVLYRLLAGQLPFPQTDVGELSLAVIKHEPGPLPATTPSGEAIGRDLAFVVRSALAKEPDARPTMAQLVAQLDAVQRGEPVMPRSRRGAVALAVAAVAGLAAAAFVVFSPVSSPAPAPPLPAAVPPEPPPEQARQTVKLTVRTEPPGATVTRDDGTALGVTPFGSALVRGDRARLHIALEGYLPVERTISAEADSVVDVVLAPKPAEVVKPTPKKPAKRVITDDGTIDPFGG
ncbi:MAG: serine/threonine protein kinase [Myxococcaceae bacterium]|nr:serine/threonine protein kinase [Myxococcaceae bacterium]